VNFDNNLEDRTPSQIQNRELQNFAQAQQTVSETTQWQNAQ